MAWIGWPGESQVLQNLLSGWEGLAGTFQRLLLFFSECLALKKLSSGTNDPNLNLFNGSRERRKLASGRLSFLSLFWDGSNFGYRSNLGYGLNRFGLSLTFDTWKILIYVDSKIDDPHGIVQIFQVTSAFVEQIYAFLRHRLTSMGEDHVGARRFVSVEDVDSGEVQREWELGTRLVGLDRFDESIHGLQNSRHGFLVIHSEHEKSEVDLLGSDHHALVDTLLEQFVLAQSLPNKCEYQRLTNGDNVLVVMFTLVLKASILLTKDPFSSVKKGRQTK